MIIDRRLYWNPFRCGAGGIPWSEVDVRETSFPLNELELQRTDRQTLPACLETGRSHADGFLSVASRYG